MRRNQHSGVFREMKSSPKNGRGAARATILVVEDHPTLRELLKEELTQLGYQVVSANSAEQALDLLATTEPQLILSDVHMGGLSGVELCAQLKSHPTFQLTPFILLTGVSDLDSRLAGLSAGDDDFFAKPFDLRELRTRVTALLKTKSVLDHLERSESIITSLGLSIEKRDPYTAGHCERFSRYASAVGQALGVDEETLKALRLGGFLHDLGKIAVPDKILLKPGPLDSIERAVIETHPKAGVDLIGTMKTMERVRPIILYHHERIDGSGYPAGLKGEEIPLEARIMAVVDVYDALRTKRSYKEPLSHEQAVGILLRETDAGYWDPRVTDTFLKVVNDLDS